MRSEEEEEVYAAGYEDDYEQGDSEGDQEMNQRGTHSPQPVQKTEHPVSASRG